MADRRKHPPFEASPATVTWDPLALERLDDALALFESDPILRRIPGVPRLMTELSAPSLTAAGFEGRFYDVRHYHQTFYFPVRYLVVAGPSFCWIVPSGRDGFPERDHWTPPPDEVSKQVPFYECPPLDGSWSPPQVSKSPLDAQESLRMEQARGFFRERSLRSVLAPYVARAEESPVAASTELLPFLFTISFCTKSPELVARSYDELPCDIRSELERCPFDEVWHTEVDPLSPELETVTFVSPIRLNRVRAQPGRCAAFVLTESQHYTSVSTTMSLHHVQLWTSNAPKTGIDWYLVRTLIWRRSNNGPDLS
ncbi:MAG: hypothetical protein ACOC1F_13730 [Myxococcota bacterium]